MRHVGLLFAFNVGSGNVLEGFALAMICGVLVGTYSSIFVACPVLHMLETRAIGARDRARTAAMVSDRASKAAV